ncbi:MAG: type III-B CRISPR module-associated Cmr3 family protein [Thermodesulforhabdaceae bacterium]
MSQEQNFFVEQWLELRPLDTLFFRGGDPMEAGETHETGRPLFPPMPYTVVGALRTAILAQRNLSPDLVKKLRDDEDLDAENLPFWGTPQKSGFRIAGPLFMVGRTLLFPAPANWFRENNKGRDILEIFQALPQDNVPRVFTDRACMVWIKNPPRDAEPVTGSYWVTAKALELSAEQENFQLPVKSRIENIRHDKAMAIPRNALFVLENRVGIARDYSLRTTRRGHLYATKHVRLKEGVFLAVGIDKPLVPSHLDPLGVFQFGGEGRMTRYRILGGDIEPPKPKANRLLLLSPLPWRLAQNEKLTQGAYASGKLIRTGGWDMRKGFHKPVETFFPAGTVFFGKSNPGLCELISF